MKQQLDSNFQNLLVHLQCCHSILGTAWPRPGSGSLANAKTFIDTKLFLALENAAAEIDLDFIKNEITESDKVLYQLWRRCHEVIKRLKTLGRASENLHIDSAFNLLYLATGILYHEVARRLPELPKQDARFATVVESAELLNQCRWQGLKTEVPTLVEESLGALLKDL